MGKKWDNTGNFYEWNKARAEKLLRVMKHGGYVAIFGHPKTNHRMKCAFEDVGFRIVEEIDWVYLSGMPKNQDISKLFDKVDEKELSNKWNGWKTAGLKPAHEPITIFQKPLNGTYINNIKLYSCSGMNIDACRVEYKNEADLNMVKAKCNFTENSKSIGFGTVDSIYGTGNTPLDQARECVQDSGRFPSNIILDEYTAELLDEQTGITQSKKGKPRSAKISNDISLLNSKTVQVTREYDDIGGGSRMFTIIKYNQKVSPSERKLPNGERNPHVTLKPVELIKWLIKLLTPVDGITIDITAGSCTHAVACEELNKSDAYNLKYIDIEIMNTEEDPYCNIGKMRVEAV